MEAPPQSEGEQRQRDLDLQRVVGELKQTLNRRLPIDPMSVIPPVKTKRHVGAGEIAVLQRQGETLHRIGCNDAK
jgi:hypothetical protein